MQKFTLFLAAVFLFLNSSAKIWRLNNNAGVTADFITLDNAINDNAVQAGDTLHLEPSATSYGNNSNLNKRLIILGPGYFLNPADPTYGGNSGLQYSNLSSLIGNLSFYPGSEGSKVMGLTISQAYIYPGTVAMNLTLEKLFFENGNVTYASNEGNDNTGGITIRKCFFTNTRAIGGNGAIPTASNVTVENCIFYNAYIDLSGLTGSGNIIRNNSWYTGNTSNSVSNAYVANNIFSSTGQHSFTNCTLKNNLFEGAQTLPGTATGNQVSVDMATVYVGGIGSYDSRVMLKTGSPAIGAGVTISSYTPNAGAFGATDPYKLSGIPAIPTIYSLTVPTSIPTGSATMNVTFSSRNNN